MYHCCTDWGTFMNCEVLLDSRWKLDNHVLWCKGYHTENSVALHFSTLKMQRLISYPLLERHQDWQTATLTSLDLWFLLYPCCYSNKNPGTTITAIIRSLIQCWLHLVQWKNWICKLICLIPSVTHCSKSNKELYYDNIVIY